MLSMLMLFVFIFISVVLLWPGITFVIAWYQNNVSLEYLNRNAYSIIDNDGFAGLPIPFKYNKISGTTKCNDGIYLGPVDQINNSRSVDCNDVCGGDGRTYEYKFIDSHHKIIINNRVLERGAWCLPSEIAKCNLNISYALSGINQYQCVTAYPELFGGSVGNRIIACSPFNSIIDRKRKKIYSQYIPPNFSIDDIDELLDDGSFRYQCYIPDDNYRNLADFGLGNRFQLMPDSCGIFESSGKLSLDLRSCTCPEIVGQQLLKNEFLDGNNQTNQIRPCSKCTSGFGIVDENLPQVGSKYGISIGLDCVDPTNATYLESENSRMPCGLRLLKKIRNNNQSRGCQRAMLNASGSYSIETLERLRG